MFNVDRERKLNLFKSLYSQECFFFNHKDKKHNKRNCVSLSRLSNHRIYDYCIKGMIERQQCINLNEKKKICIDKQKVLPDIYVKYCYHNLSKSKIAKHGSYVKYDFPDEIKMCLSFVNITYEK